VILAESSIVVENGKFAMRHKFLPIIESNRENFEVSCGRRLIKTEIARNTKGIFYAFNIGCRASANLFAAWLNFETICHTCPVMRTKAVLELFNGLKLTEIQKVALVWRYFPALNCISHF
jgi:hypothetical protein